jgi:hypothetical protein
LTAFTRDKVDIRYDPARDRIVFMIHNDEDKIIGGVGRALSSVALPKWYVYGSRNYPFICGGGDTAVVVEDCASACAVSNDFAGVALTRVVILEDDLKYFKPDEIREILCRNDN